MSTRHYGEESAEFPTAGPRVFAHVELPYTEPWFAPPPGALFGPTPKLGILHSDVVHRFEAVWKAVDPLKESGWRVTDRKSTPVLLAGTVRQMDIDFLV